MEEVHSFLYNSVQAMVILSLIATLHSAMEQHGIDDTVDTLSLLYVAETCGPFSFPWLTNSNILSTESLNTEGLNLL